MGWVIVWSFLCLLVSARSERARQVFDYPDANAKDRTRFEWKHLGDAAVLQRRRRVYQENSRASLEPHAQAMALAGQSADARGVGGNCHDAFSGVHAHDHDRAEIATDCSE